MSTVATKTKGRDDALFILPWLLIMLALMSSPNTHHESQGDSFDYSKPGSYVACYQWMGMSGTTYSVTHNGATSDVVTCKQTPEFHVLVCSSGVTRVQEQLPDGGESAIMEVNLP